MKRASVTIFDQGMVALLVILLPFCLLAVRAYAGEEMSGKQVRQAVDTVAESGAFDLSVVEAIGKLPREERAPLAAKLAESPNPAMRFQALLILESFPPKVAAETFRKLLGDESRDNQNLAALYLAKQTKDPEARAILLKNASDDAPKTAAAAVRVLGRLEGADVNEFFLNLLMDDDTPKEVRLAAIAAAGNARAAECTPVLVELLDNKELRSTKWDEKVRMCDLAASALETIHRVNYTGIKYVYFNGPVEKRDQAIALWKKWYETQDQSADEHPRTAYVGRVLEESLKELQASPDEDQREVIKGKLTSAVGLAFCLGDLQGVDAVVSPTVVDLWKMMQAHGERWWYKFLSPWQALSLAYRSEFLPKIDELPPDPDRQALAFIRFAEGRPRHTFRGICVWSLCRNFAEAFPESELITKVSEIKEELEAEFKKAKKQVVVHGHIPVLEPVPAPPPAGRGWEADERGALLTAVRREPSNWQAHRSLVGFYARRGLAMSTYPFLEKHAKLYPGNGWTFLADAAYQLRVKNKPESAIKSADKALILNPGNAKAYAVRGMIRVVSKLSPDEAVKDLTRAFELDPKSLGDEPETLEAICFLVEKALESGDEARARTYLEALGELKAFRADRPVKKTAEYKKLVERVSGQ